MNTKYLSFIGILQTFAFLCVLAGHALSLYSNSGWYGHWHIVSSLNNLNEFIYSFHMPLFFFISGYLLFYTTKGQIKWFQYNYKRFKRLIIPFYLAGFLYYLPLIFFINPGKTPFVVTFQGFVTLYSPGYLWFLVTLFSATLLLSLFLISPLRKYPFLLFILLAIANIFPQTFGLPDVICKKVMINCLYLYIGYLTAKHPVEKYINKLNIFLLFTFSGLFFHYHFYTLTSCGFILAFYALFYYISFQFPQIANYQFIKFISANMLLLYILHEPIMIGLLKSWRYASMINPYIGATSLFLLDLFITMNLVYIYKLLKPTK